tara:strand:- start:43 stop:1215 length:1173 start_codon:yes stop_codon:yes gene_type:complete
MKPRYIIDVSFSQDDENRGLLSKNAFNFSTKGDYWLLSTNNYQFKKENFKALGFNNLNLKSNSNLSVQDKTLFRYPKLDLPRQKVDLLKEKYNCKVIRDSSKADIHIISLKFIESLITQEWRSSITFNDTFKILKFMKESGFLSQSGLEKVKSMIADIPRDAMISFNLMYIANSGYNNIWYTMEAMRDKISDFIKNNKKNFRTYSRDFILESANISNFNKLLQTKAQIVIDTEVCDIIDKDLAVLDVCEYDTIQSMIKSSDIENRSLALEMISNCNISKSYDVVSGLYYWNYDWLKSTNNWNTVNVKAFRKRMKPYAGGYSTSTISAFNNYLNLLEEDNMLTQYAVDKTKKLLYDTLLDTLIGKSADVFNISLDDLKIEDRLKDKILTND